MKVNKSVEPSDRKRLSRQCEEILGLLQLGKRTNRDLAHIALKYTSRISEIREHLEKHEGKTVHCNRLDDGLTEYEIVELPPPDQMNLDLLAAG